MERMRYLICYANTGAGAPLAVARWGRPKARPYKEYYLIVKAARLFFAHASSLLP